MDIIGLFINNLLAYGALTPHGIYGDDAAVLVYMNAYPIKIPFQFQIIKIV